MSASRKHEEQEKFYQISKDYWATQPATVNGMLGGFDYISDIDIQQSQNFLNYFLNVMIRLFLEFE